MKKTRLRTIGLGVVLVAAGLAVGWIARGAYDAWTEEVATIRIADAARVASSCFEIELFASTPGDEARRTLCLLDGSYGMGEQNGHIVNWNSHVDFDHHQAGSFTAGVQGNEDGQVVDLGDISALEREFGGPPLSVFRWHDGAVYAEGLEHMVPDPVGRPPPPSAARRWLARVLKVPSIAAAKPGQKSAQVKPGHVYFVRIVRSREEDLVALLHVVEHDVGRRVKIRCVQL